MPKRTTIDVNNNATFMTITSINVNNINIFMSTPNKGKFSVQSMFNQTFWCFKGNFVNIFNKKGRVTTNVTYPDNFSFRVIMITFPPFLLDNLKLRRIIRHVSRASIVQVPFPSFLLAWTLQNRVKRRF